MQLPPLQPARLVRRYKRFLADVTLEASGAALTVHCPNPGSMMGLKAPGSRVWISRSDNPKRKLAHTLELVEADGGLVAINTNNPNRLAEEAIRAGTIGALKGFERLRREVPYAGRSRVDIVLEGGGATTFVEVKNCHLMRTPGLAEFPDSVTARGAKHLEDLAAEAARGHRAVMLFIVQRADCHAFATAPDLDATYAAGLEAAARAGVEVLVHGCHITTLEITVGAALPWQTPAPRSSDAPEPKPKPGALHTDEP
ncbi:MAG: DNA/RNA nuclease SfsA [Pseudomonadota bacterium]